MIDENETLELGTTEAAVRSCVNLIALATHTSENKLAYWLDCYYQLRLAHERRVRALDDVYSINEELSEGIGDLSEGFEPYAPKTGKGDSKKKLTEPDAEQCKASEDPEDTTRTASGYAWRDYKRAVYSRLQEARAKGVKIARIVEASGGKLSQSTVLDILDAKFRPIQDYRALDAALAQCAE